MCEIILIITLARKIAGIASAKGRNGFGYGSMFVGLWIGGEFLGAIVGALLFMGPGGGRKDAAMMVYLCALAGAAAGAILSFIIVNSLSPVEILRREYQEYYRDSGDDFDVTPLPRRPRRSDDDGRRRSSDYQPPTRSRDEPPDERIRR